MKEPPPQGTAPDIPRSNSGGGGRATIHETGLRSNSGLLLSLRTWPLPGFFLFGLLLVFWTETLFLIIATGLRFCFVCFLLGGAPFVFHVDLCVSKPRSCVSAFGSASPPPNISRMQIWVCRGCTRPNIFHLVSYLQTYL